MIKKFKYNYIIYIILRRRFRDYYYKINLLNMWLGKQRGRAEVSDTYSVNLHGEVIHVWRIRVNMVILANLS